MKFFNSWLLANKIKYRILFIFLSPLFFVNCSASSGSGDGIIIDSNDLNQINTAKLVGTPFEGKTYEDNLPQITFLCGQYATERIDSFPILVFSALFTNAEEAVVADGIDLANAGMGFEAYRLTEEWNDQVRVIYKVKKIDSPHATGHTAAKDRYFINSVTANTVPDWAIIIENATSIYEIAHELGHASGIIDHALINYSTGGTSPLESHSIMQSAPGTRSTDYNFMMQKQGEIMLDHLGEEGTLRYEVCP